MNKEDGLGDPWAKREALGDVYWNDPRWKRVVALRKKGDEESMLEANSLVFKIRAIYDLDS